VVDNFIWVDIALFNKPAFLFYGIYFLFHFINSYIFLLVKASGGTRIRTGVQGSEAPDAIRYTIPPCCFKQQLCANDYCNKR
jgi:hypothetical protein